MVGIVVGIVIVPQRFQLPVHIHVESLPGAAAMFDQDVIEIPLAGFVPAPIQRQHVGDLRVLVRQCARSHLLGEASEPVDASRQQAIDGLGLAQANHLLRNGACGR